MRKKSVRDMFLQVFIGSYSLKIVHWFYTNIEDVDNENLRINNSGNYLINIIHRLESCIQIYRVERLGQSSSIYYELTDGEKTLISTNDNEYREKLYMNRFKVIHSMIEPMKILDYLASKSIIQLATISRIEHKYPVPEDRNRALLDLILTYPAKAYYPFIEALYLSGNNSLIDLLEPNFSSSNEKKQLDDEYGLIHRSVNRIQQNLTSTLTTTLTTTNVNYEDKNDVQHLHTSSSEILEEIPLSSRYRQNTLSDVDDKEFDLELPMGFSVRLLLPNVIEQYPDLDPSNRKSRVILCYPMSNILRGQCLLINNVEDFKTMEKRHGSDIDASKLRSLFEQMGFNVIVRRNMKCLDPGNCSIVIILSYGCDGRIYGVDERYLDIDRQIISVFDDHFIGKPKIFILQASRSGQRNYRSDGVLDQLTSSKMLNDYGHITKVAKRSDMVIWHSTLKDCVSWRQTDEGSIFIQTLITVFAKASWRYDLVTMAECVCLNNIVFSFHYHYQILCVF
ncbi:unnamed protein product [Didymodactylos carnosus]|uniref:Caspase-8 n=1 Tax=Didymodactylos carnosus TaxID=1234261 RepID=A0A814T3N3_9BILA|nr:unnamed protein product [Didymodactylos carnosus]CAF1154752.1 unnamed protein product [Didymodactylos carnosus]CAF3848228.1 unnamed protein product [Didymodactylos carnosus]CAF3918239.1 unnamed protein product [Didymodactylos carnosus]